MICRVSFRFLRIFGEKSQKSKRENLGKNRLLSHSVGNPHRGVALLRSVGCPRHGEAEVPKWNPLGTPRLSGVLRHNGVLRRSVAVLCLGVSTVHGGQNFGFLFRKCSIRTLIV